jgi:hypothetical protein
MYLFDTLKGILHIHLSPKHEQYPFNTLDQNNSAHGIYSVGIAFLLGFVIVIQFLSKF